MPPGRIAVRLRPTARTATCSSPWARKARAPSTPSTGKLLHIIRKVILRVSTKLDWLVLKLH